MPASGRAAEDGSNKMAMKWTGVDVGGALATFTKRKKKEESSSKIKVTDADKVMREWGDSMSWDSSRLDGTALDGMKARTPDLFDAILGQTAIDVDELETLERQRRAKRIAKELERRRKKRERVLEQEKNPIMVRPRAADDARRREAPRETRTHRLEDARGLTTTRSTREIAV